MPRTTAAIVSRASIVDAASMISSQSMPDVSAARVKGTAGAGEAAGRTPGPSTRAGVQGRVWFATVATVAFEGAGWSAGRAIAGLAASEITVAAMTAERVNCDELSMAPLWVSGHRAAASRSSFRAARSVPVTRA